MPMTAASEMSLEELWHRGEGASPPPRPDLSNVPPAARRYLEHAVPAGAPLASAVRLRMKGEIKLKRWSPFTAEQVISWGHGMIWQARVRMGALPIRGSDRWIEGEGAMSWKLFGLVPLVRASGADITRSTAGRVNVESIWLPSVLCHEAVSWTAGDPPRARFDAHGESVEIELGLEAGGSLQSVRLRRWGNPEGGEFRWLDFGGVVEREDRLGDYVIPTRLRVGWHFGSDRFESEGEFFRAEIEEAVFR